MTINSKKSLADRQSPSPQNQQPQRFNDSKVEDWWEVLDEETKEGILEADKDIERGNFVSRDELFGKYRHLL